MAGVTPLRLKHVKPIIEKFREKLASKGEFSCDLFEMELQKELDTDGNGLRDFLCGLVKEKDCDLVCLFFMQNHQTASGADHEFKGILADAYGIDMYDSDEQSAAEKAFWKSAIQSLRDQ